MTQAPEYRLVPVEPTEAQIEAGRASDGRLCRAVYIAMVAAEVEGLRLDAERYRVARFEANMIHVYAWDQAVRKHALTGGDRLDAYLDRIIAENAALSSAAAAPNQGEAATPDPSRA